MGTLERGIGPRDGLKSSNERGIGMDGRKGVNQKLEKDGETRIWN